MGSTYFDGLDDEKVDRKIQELRKKIDNMDPIQKPPNEHWLENTYCLWSLAWSDPHNKHDKDYVNNLQLIASFGTVEQWWSIYSHLININYLPPYMELNLFKTGILPMWEDPANIRGGRWMVRINKESGAKAWEDLCLAVLGEQFMVGNEICGVSVSLKKHEVKLTVWNRTSDDNVTTVRIRDTLKRILNYVTFNRIEYSMHY